MFWNTPPLSATAAMPVRSRMRSHTWARMSTSVAWNRAAIRAAGASRSRSSTTPRTTSVVRTTIVSPTVDRRRVEHVGHRLGKGLELHRRLRLEGDTVAETEQAGHGVEQPACA